MIKPKMIIAGGTGFCGKALQQHFANKYELFVLTRTPNCKNHIKWDGKTLTNWVNIIDGAEVLINLTGRIVDCRYNKKNKGQILNSRIDSTSVLSKAMKGLEKPPKVWINASTATIYRHTVGDKAANTERGGVIGSMNNFSESVALRWEAEFFSENIDGLRKVALRTAIVLGKQGGAFPVMYKLANWGLCTPQASGMQWISWIHINDFCRSVEHVIRNKKVEGVINICTPKPVTNRNFNAYLKQKCRPIFTLPQPKFLLEIGAFFMRTETELILKSRKVFPEKLIESGFDFKYPSIQKCLDDLI